MPEGLLEGIQVLDLGSYLSGPFCAKLLADYGADVIKVEPPQTGDVARRNGPFVGDDPHPEKSISFLYLNTNKRGITLDVGSESGRLLLRSLLQRTDSGPTSRCLCLSIAMGLTEVATGNSCGPPTSATGLLGGSAFWTFTKRREGPALWCSWSGWRPRPTSMGRSLA